MASLDVRDVLNLPSDGGAPRPAKKQKTAAPRPNLKGLAREVQSLGGDNPIAIVPEVSLFKKRRFASRKLAARWELRSFRNSARPDGSLVLRHWRRKTDGAPNEPQQDAQDGQADAEQQPEAAEGGAAAEDAGPQDAMEDSSFAKYNVEVSVPQYNDDQYNTKLQNSDWTKGETDYLMELVKSHDLRWPVIWDRYDYSPRPPEDAANEDGSAVVPATRPRTMEDLKARYYEIAAKMMDVQKPVQYMTRPEWDLHQMMANFNPNQERLRKEFALNSLSRSKEEAREEESLLLEVKRILARSERFNEERRELYSRLDFPHTDQDISAFKSSAGLQNLLQNLMNVDKSKKRKSIMGAEGVSPAAPNGQTPASAASESTPNRRDSIAAVAPPPSHHRDSVGADKPTPADKKKGAQPVERRKLTEQEQQIYGVTHHDRLGSGPTFRTEKVNKLFSHKSGQQQLRITNALNELDVPSRLTMPTAAVTSQFEQLLHAVTALVDLRKVSDKLDAEIKVEEAKRSERLKAKGVLGEGAGADGQSSPRDTEKEAGEDSGDAAKATVADPAAAEALTADSTKEGGAPPPDGESDEAQAAEEGDTVPPMVQVKKEEGHKEKTPRPGSSGGHKRSASVLSTTSDKSAKRQKK